MTYFLLRLLSSHSDLVGFGQQVAVTRVKGTDIQLEIPSDTTESSIP